jgi:hypothetical protein
MTRSVAGLALVFGSAVLIGCAGNGARHARARAPNEHPGVSRDAGALREAGYTKPRSVVPHCVEKSFRIPKTLEGVATDRPYTVKFAILADGRVDRFEMLSRDAPEPLTLELKRAVETCEWIAGTDREGQPAAIWILLPLRFGRVAK